MNKSKKSKQIFNFLHLQKECVCEREMNMGRIVVCPFDFDS